MLSPFRQPRHCDISFQHETSRLKFTLQSHEEMYAGWHELRVCEEARERSASVLQKFPTASSGAVVHAVVQSLAQSLGLSSGQPEPSSLITGQLNGSSTSLDIQ